MANIDTYLQQILAAIYGEDVRGSIHDAIEAINDQVDAAEETMDQFVQGAMDTTLTSTTKPAEGKAVGDALDNLKTDITQNLYTETDNWIWNNKNFWTQGGIGGSQGYMVHSEKIYPTESKAFYFGGICTGEQFYQYGYLRFKYFDANDNLLYTSGSRTIGRTWATASTTALVVYNVAYMIAEYSTNEASTRVTPETLSENYKLYAGYTNITSFDDWYDHYGPKVDALGAEVSELESDLLDLTGRVENIENEIPTYWKTYLDGKVSTLRALDGRVGTHGFSFVFITDVHWENNFKKSPALINYILKRTSVDLVICGGDIITRESSIDAAMAVIDDWGYNTKPLETINIYGNHDNNSNGGNASSIWIGYDRWYGSLIKPISDKITQFSENMKYFYVDIPLQKVRLFCMNTGYDQGEGLDSTQAAWLQQQLYGLPEGYKALVLQHIFFAPATIESGITQLSITGSGTLCKSMCDGQYDNIVAHGAEFIGIVTGHVHRDYSITSEKGYPIIGTTCDANGLQASLYDPANPTRTSGTTTEQAFDVYHVDTSNKKIYVTRIGAGSDREFSY